MCILNILNGFQAIALPGVNWLIPAPGSLGKWLIIAIQEVNPVLGFIVVYAIDYTRGKALFPLNLADIIDAYLASAVFYVSPKRSCPNHQAAGDPLEYQE